MPADVGGAALCGGGATSGRRLWVGLAEDVDGFALPAALDLPGELEPPAELDLPGELFSGVVSEAVRDPLGAGTEAAPCSAGTSDWGALGGATGAWTGWGEGDDRVGVTGVVGALALTCRAPLSRPTPESACRRVTPAVAAPAGPVPVLALRAGATETDGSAPSRATAPWTALTIGGLAGIGLLRDPGQLWLETKATTASPVAVTSPSRPIEVLRRRTRRPSPARVEPTTLRDSSCPILESTTTPIGSLAGRVEDWSG